MIRSNPGEMWGKITNLFHLLHQNTVDQLLKDTNLAGVIGTHSWKEQFIEAVTVSAG